MKPSRLPIRWRLTLWYLLSFTAILLLFAGFLYWQVQRSLLAQIDSGLQLAATQALVNVETLQEMEGQVDRLIRLSSDLLFMARLDQGQMVQQRERIDVQDFLGAVVDQIRPLATAKTIVVSQTIPPELTLQGDMDLLIRLFLNLLDNAVKYTPKNGRVTISANQDTTDLRITITDTGPGIATEHLPYLFDRFYRVETARSRSGTEAGGAGLGLAIAHEIASAHSGNLEVSSQIGQGTTFIVIFPLPKEVK